ncbi:hypothetical protein PT974_01842 [Cladobotryum mycophilum]|uniref:Uncharacterized protein n=1 Tax=Cladobotryum mycophilum TaxID=491253 RepID=A0ABR0SWG9_9HYPO
MRPKRRAAQRAMLKAQQNVVDESADEYEFFSGTIATDICPSTHQANPKKGGLEGSDDRKSNPQPSQLEGLANYGNHKSTSDDDRSYINDGVDYRKSNDTTPADVTRTASSCDRIAAHSSLRNEAHMEVSPLPEIDSDDSSYNPDDDLEDDFDESDSDCQDDGDGNAQDDINNESDDANDNREDQPNSPTTNPAATSLSHNQIPAAIISPVPRSDWTSPTRLMKAFADKHLTFTTIVKSMESIQSEQQLDEFLEDPARYPADCGWITQWLPQFRAHRGEKAVLFLLHCPLREHVISLQGVPKCLTEEIILLIAKYLLTFNIRTIAVDVRKECQRAKDNSGCLHIRGEERVVCSLATIGEAIIARNVFGIEFIATIAASWNACAALDTIHTWPSSSFLFGTSYRIDWHPRKVADLIADLAPASAVPVAKHLILRDYTPVVRSVVELFGHTGFNEEAFWNYFWQSASVSFNTTLSSAFLPVAEFDLYSDGTIQPFDYSRFRDANPSEFDHLLQACRDRSRMLRKMAYFERTVCRTALEVERLILNDQGVDSESRSNGPGGSTMDNQLDASN